MFLSQIEKSPQFHNFRVTKGKSLLPVIISKPGQRFPTMSEKKTMKNFKFYLDLEATINISQITQDNNKINGS